MRSLAPFAFLISSICSGQPGVQLFWSGGLTSTSVGIRARIGTETDSVRVAYCAEPCTGEPQYTDLAAADSVHDLVARMELTGLLPGTGYTYRFEVDGILDTSALHSGSFRTPQAGPASFSFVVGSCNGFSMHPVWQAMRDLDPLFFLSTGDLHYRDPNSTDVEVHYVPYREDVLGWSPMKDLLHQAPIAYVWDDHDFSGNGSDGNSLGKYSAARAYRDYVPHYPLNDEVSVHQAFTIGRVHFILSDLRSSKSSDSMMDFGQYTWLLQQFLHARDNGLIAAWVSPLTWNSTGYPENWACQPDERTAINDFLYAQEVENLFILCGDAHMLAIDDGANADFSSAQDLRYHYPIFQAAAISRNGSYKGGNFNQGGVFPNPNPWNGQFGEVKVQDDGQDVCITFNGYRTDSMSASITLIDQYTFCRTLGPVGISTPTAGNSTGAKAVMEGSTMVLDWPFVDGPGSVGVHDALGRSLVNVDVRWGQGRLRLALPQVADGLLIVRMSAGPKRATLRLLKP